MQTTVYLILMCRERRFTKKLHPYFSLSDMGKDLDILLSFLQTYGPLAAWLNLYAVDTGRSLHPPDVRHLDAVRKF